MFNKFRKEQFATYQKARRVFIEKPDILIGLEKYFSVYIKSLLEKNLEPIQSDYDETNYLYPFWQQYPPDERGRKPRGDQYPWIEVGEHAIGDKLPRMFQEDFCLRDVGLPTGPDKRFIASNKDILKITEGLTSSAWLFIDIKSVGPRDDFEHTVMSHNQISGDGLWADMKSGIKNTVMIAVGKISRHEFHCSIPPLYVLSDMTVVPVILLAIKPVYKMLSLENSGQHAGQPLNRLVIVAIPNGILMQINPGYLQQYPALLFPGKDDKQKNPLKVRCRISFDILREIAYWRVQEIILE
jgi:hypothetical protein